MRIHAVAVEHQDGLGPGHNDIDLAGVAIRVHAGSATVARTWPLAQSLLRHSKTGAVSSSSEFLGHAPGIELGQFPSLCAGGLWHLLLLLPPPWSRILAQKVPQEMGLWPPPHAWESQRLESLPL